MMYHGEPASGVSGLHTCHFITLFGHVCLGDLGMHEKDIAADRAGMVFFPLRLSKLVHLGFDCDPPHHLRCGIFHL